MALLIAARGYIDKQLTEAVMCVGVASKSATHTLKYTIQLGAEHLMRKPDS